jgi:hypothetical protein
MKMNKMTNQVRPKILNDTIFIEDLFNQVR